MFAEEAVKELRLVRDVLAGKSRIVTAKLAFAGVLLPPGTRFDIGNGTVRSVTDADRQFVPESLKGQLAGADLSGVTTTINYDGDVLLEYKFPYRVKVLQGGLGETPPSWPNDMLPPPDLERTSVRLRFSLMLAVEREQRAQLVQTWRSFDEPLNQGYGASWNDPRQGTGIMPMQLTDAEVAACASGMIALIVRLLLKLSWRSPESCEPLRNAASHPMCSLIQLSRGKISLARKRVS